MFYSPINYHEPLFRPPAEAYSLIFQITLGCSWNKCAFCEMYTSKQFKVRSEEDVIAEIKLMSELYPATRKIFLADGNAMVLSTPKLVRILEAIKTYFPRVMRVSTYASPSELVSKSDAELLVLKEAGLKLVYVGIETGDDELLKLINKGETYESITHGLLKAKQAGIKSSVMILNGLGGKVYTEQHAINSARILNATQPDFTSLLVLSFPFGEEHYKKRFLGNYISLSIVELMQEVELMVKHSELDASIFRTNHASNYLTLEGVLGRDKEKILKQIQFAIDHPLQAGLREEWQRGL